MCHSAQVAAVARCCQRNRAPRQLATGQKAIVLTNYTEGTTRHKKTLGEKAITASDSSRPNDSEFLARITRLRLALHKAKHAACAERIRDVLATGQKLIVFTSYTEGAYFGTA